MYHGTIVRYHGCGSDRCAMLHVLGHVLVLRRGRRGICHVVPVHGCRVLGDPEMGERGVPTVRQSLAGIHRLHDRAFHRGSLVELAGNSRHRVYLLFQEIRNN